MASNNKANKDLKAVKHKGSTVELRGHSRKGRAAMGSRTLLLVGLVGLILASSQLRIPSEVVESDERLEGHIAYLFNEIAPVNRYHRLYSFITYPGNISLRPSLDQRLMDNFSVPTYTVGSNQGPLNHRYPTSNIMVVAIFRGLDDPALAALNDTELAIGFKFYRFLYIPPGSANRPMTTEEIQEFFTWCWERSYTVASLFFRGESEFETWTYFYVTNVTVVRHRRGGTIWNVLRSQGYRFLVQVSNDPVLIFWYNSTEQADVIGGGNISMSGVIGIMMVEFMRYINASMDIIPIQKMLSSDHKIPEVPTSRSVDMVANLLQNDSLQPYSPVVTVSQICLLVPHRRRAEIHSYFRGTHWYSLAVGISVFSIKYIAYRRRFPGLAMTNTIRFILGLPMPGGQLNRLPLADKIIEVYCFLFVGLLLSTFGSVMSSLLTVRINWPPITDVESLRASGLRIVTSDPTMLEFFRDNSLPSSLLDLVDLVDDSTFFKRLVDLDDSWVYVIKKPNWHTFQFYQERLKRNRLTLAGPKLCSSERQLRIPISPTSPLRLIFDQYYHLTMESGLHLTWLQRGFRKFREVYGLPDLPRDPENEWRPFSLAFLKTVFKIYIYGMLLSTLVFIIEILYKRYRG